MVRRNYKKKGYRKRGRNVPWYAKKYNALQIAQGAWKGVKYLKGLVNAERHYLVTSGTSNPSTSGTVIALSAVAQGDTVNNRTGNSFLARSLFGRITFLQNTSATVCVNRVIIFVDKQQVADTSPAVTDVLLTADVRSSLNTSLYPGRFKIIKDMTVMTDDSMRQAAYRKIMLNLYTHIKYNGVNSSDIARNGLYMLLLSTEATNTPTIDYNLKLGWYDN